MEHWVDPRLDLLSAPYDKWHKGKIPESKQLQVRALQDPNTGLFQQPAACSSSGAR